MIKRCTRGRSSWLIALAAGAILLASAATSNVTHRLPFPNPEAPAGCRPGDLAAGDFNNDGYPDLAVASRNAGFGSGCRIRPGIDVLLGEGDASFTRTFHLEVSLLSPTLGASDFNSDGNLDLALVDDFVWGAWVLLGDGDGTFGEPLVHEAGLGSFTLATGDFNADGKPDLAVANRCSTEYGCENSEFMSEVSILLSSTQGEFQAPVFTQVPLKIGAIASGDFNVDGRDDLALIRNPVGHDPDSRLMILLGRGDGSFSSLGPTLAGPGASFIGIADFNNDSRPDLAILNAGFGLTSFSIWFGNGEGAFPHSVGYYLSARTAQIGDFNGDGRLDLAVVGISGADRTVITYLNDGAGGFNPTAASTAGSLGTSAAGDFNDDGFLDLAVAGVAKASIHLGRGNGMFGNTLERIEGSAASDSFGLGDFDRDGRSDLAMVAICENGPYGPIYGVIVRPSRSAEGPDTPTCYVLADTPRVFLSDDFNRDSIDDLIVLQLFGVSTLLGRGDGTFHPEIPLPLLFTPHAGAIGDLNADGIPDLVVAEVCPAGICPSEYQPNVPGKVHILLGAGDGTFVRQQSYEVGPLPTSAAVGDLNGDGLLDIAVPSGSEHRRYECWYCPVAVLLGNGDGTFQQRKFFPAGADAVDIAVGDFNSDGLHDLVIVNRASNDLSILAGHPDLVLNPEVRYEVGATPVAIELLDFDRDGLSDIAVANSLSQNVSILGGTGDGTFLPQMLFLVENHVIRLPVSLSAGDFDGDGRPDLGILNGGCTFGGCYGSTITLLLNQSEPVNRPPVANAGPDFQAECTVPPSLLTLTDPPQPVGNPVTLDGSGSSDPDSSAGTNDDITAFDWFLDYGIATQRLLGSGERITVGLSLGVHSITLRVTDSEGELSTDGVMVSIADTTPPVLACPAPMSAECTSPDGTFLSLQPTVSDVCDLLPHIRVTREPPPTVIGPCRSIQPICGVYPLGTTSVTLTATDAAGNSSSCATTVTVSDTAPPELSLAMNAQTLWPPNHRMVPLQASAAAADVCSPAPQIALLSVSSSEPDDAPGSGDGNTRSDVQGAETGTADLDFSLRAERDGNGLGRTYTVIYAATDASGNSTTRSAAVFVPHDQGGVVEPVLIKADETTAGTLLRWSEAPGALAYSVVRGDVRSLRQTDAAIDLGEAACIESGSQDTTTAGREDPQAPAPGEAFFYVVEYGASESSSYGTETASKPRIVSSGGCLPLSAGGDGERRRSP